MPTLGISIIAHNEEKCIAGAIQSALFADDIVVVNCESTDRTEEIVKSFERVRYFERQNNQNLNVNKSYGIEQLKTDWVFYLDPDEIIPAELAAEIKSAIADEQYAAYRLPRKNYFFGRWLRYGSQYPDLQLRLFKNGKASFAKRHVHEKLQIDGKTGLLKNAFEHYPYPEIPDYLRKMMFYSEFQAQFWLDSEMSAGLPTIWQRLYFKPWFRFVRRYIFKQGFRDGWQGFVAAAGDIFQGIFSYARFLELRSKSK